MTDAANTTARHGEFSDKILRVPLSQIYIDLQWNARRQASVQLAAIVTDESDNTLEPTAPPDIDESGADTDRLAELMRTSMQETPVWVERIEEIDTRYEEGFRYILLAGFKRCEAIRRVAATAQAAKPPVQFPMVDDPSFDSSKPTVRIEIKTGLKDSTRRLLNLTENTARGGLSTADITWGIYDYLVTLKREGERKPTLDKLKDKIGLSAGYTFQLQKIGEVIGPINGGAIFRSWRNATSPVSAAAMYRMAIDCQHTPERVMDEYRKLVRGETPPEKAVGKQKTPHEAALFLAGKMGYRLGRMQDAGLILGATGIVWSETALEMAGVKVPRNSTPSQVVEIQKAMQVGIMRGLKEKSILEAEG